MSEPSSESSTSSAPSTNPVHEALEHLKTLASQADELLNKIRAADDAVASHNSNVSDGAKWLSDTKADLEAKAVAVSNIEAKTQADHVKILEVLAAAEGIRNAAETKRVAIEADQSQSATILKQMQPALDRASTCVATLDTNAEQFQLLLERMDSAVYASEKLLAGATSVGLAISYDTRKKEFSAPRILWNVAVLVGVIALSIISAYSVTTADPTSEFSTFLMWLVKKILLSGPFVYLLWYASKQADIARRVEEDYAFKVATAMAFEGFKKQVAQLQTGDNTAIGQLTARVLQIMTDRPSTVFDKHDKKEKDTLVSTIEAAKQFTGQSVSQGAQTA